ncbi:thioesterase II family protein [Streptomyces zagrosensis]|uniref:Medium-chain acyl-[acyl-carrier-protein] hydrolase n=1 Tax=Streptomyces zagrosensis TaxID=1042984 RepID=A0A7W9QAN3_9ACTN|nr:thioesterase [Streptomyces zagrosensis]MBB5936680.1 medium-chain acyl-[acyl-carrier-protein] hydrolase [Streptomyces zagrosensis]
MNQPTAHQAQAWLPFEAAPAARPRLYCFPNAGAGAASFAQWRALAVPGTAVCPVQPPGRAERFREKPHASLDALLDELTDALRGQFTGTYALYGHSLGALVAFELTRRLRREGEQLPVHLFVSGRAAPQLPDTRRALRDLPTAQLIGELARMGGTPDEVLREESLMSSLLPLIRADFAINETYTYREEQPLNIPLTAFGGQQDPRAEEAELAAWSLQTSAHFDLRMFPGGHFFINDNAGTLVKEMTALLPA